MPRQHDLEEIDVHSESPVRRYVAAFDWLARIPSTIARFWFRSRGERHVRLMSAELQALGDRMLKDIGLRRCQIESAVLNGGRAEWYVPLADTDWPAAPTPRTHRMMAARNLTERHNNR